MKLSAIMLLSRGNILAKKLQTLPDNTEINPIAKNILEICKKRRQTDLAPEFIDPISSILVYEKATQIYFLKGRKHAPHLFRTYCAFGCCIRFECLWHHNGRPSGTTRQPGSRRY
jgi:hypothetical protein